MQEENSRTPVEDLLHNANKAQELRGVLRKDSRNLTLNDVAEIIAHLTQARDTGRQAITEAAEQDKSKLQYALDQLQDTLRTAERIHERKLKWETEVEANARLITGHATRAAQCHKQLREQRRTMHARDVEALMQELATLEQESLAAWQVASQHQLPPGLEHRLFRATEVISNALKDAEGTIARKKPWEDAVATNIAAVDAELKRLESVVFGPNGPAQEAPAAQAAPAPRAEQESEAGSPEAILDEVLSEAYEEAPTDEFAIPSPQEVAAAGEGAAAPGDAAPAARPPRRGGRLPMDIVRQIRKIEELLRTRKPIDRDALGRLDRRLQQAIAQARLTMAEEAPVRERPAGPTPAQRRAQREEQKTNRLELENLFNQIEATLVVSWTPPRPRAEAPGQSIAVPVEASAHAEAPVDAAAQADAPADASAEALEEAQAVRDEQAAEAAAQALEAQEALHAQASDDAPEAHAEQPAGEAAASDKPRGKNDRPRSSHQFIPLEEPIKAGAGRVVQDQLARARELLEKGNLFGPDRRILWSRYRFCNEAMFFRRSESRKAELGVYLAQVEAAEGLATSGNPMQARKAIQEAQKAITSSPLPRGSRDDLLKRLRVAWNNADSRQSNQREERRKKEQEGLQKLGEHLMRWEDRHEGIAHKLARMEHMLEEIKERQRTSTSIGYRVVAEKRMQELRAQLVELKQVKDQLEQKITDVKPRLQSVGWTPGSAPADGSAEAPVDQAPAATEPSSEA